MIIYLITNKTNSKKYVGQTIQPMKERFKQHCYRGVRGCSVLYNAIKKYGRENFTIEQIDSAENRDELDEKEIYWIEYYNSLVPNGYNIHTGGLHHETSKETREKMSKANKGRRHTEETKRKISEANKGRVFSEEHRKKIKENHARLCGEKNSFYGKRHTEETKRKISDANKGVNHAFYGKHLPKETCEKIRLALTGRHHSEETKLNISKARKGKQLTEKQKIALDKVHALGLRKVLCVELNKTFNSVKEAGEFLNMYPSNVGRACKNEKATCAGFHWKYIDHK